ncbi:MAG: dTDP-4-dehydrorhamnose 3,5-epimerase family protein [Sphingomonadaceae bacterium]
MQFHETQVAGAFLVDVDLSRDARGAFGRLFCQQAFRRAGIHFEVLQTNISRNPTLHTLRGLHTQRPPHEEPKLVQCTSGRVFDVAVDLRPGSPTRGAVVTVELAADSDRLFYIPPGCAHGFLTLEPHSTLIYYMGAPFVPGVGMGVRFDDPAFAIPWPAPPAVISPRDAGYPDFAGFGS